MVCLRPSNQVICLPASCIAVAFLVVCRRRRPSECHSNYRCVLEVDLVATQHPLRDRKNNQSFIYGQSSTNPTNVMKIGPVDVEISDLTEIAKIYFKIFKQQQNINPSRLRLAQSGWANNAIYQCTIFISIAPRVMAAQMLLFCMWSPKSSILHDNCLYIKQIRTTYSWCDIAFRAWWLIVPEQRVSPSELRQCSLHERRQS